MRSSSCNRSLLGNRLRGVWSQVAIVSALGTIASCSDPSPSSRARDAAVDASLSDASVAPETTEAGVTTSNVVSLMTTEHSTSSSNGNRTTTAATSNPTTSAPTTFSPTTSAPAASSSDTSDPISHGDASVDDSSTPSATQEPTTSSTLASTLTNPVTSDVPDAQAPDPAEAAIADAEQTHPSELDAASTSSSVNPDAGIHVAEAYPETNPIACSFERDVIQFEGSLEQVVIGPQGSLYLLGSQNDGATLRKLDAQGNVAWTWETNDMYGPMVCFAVSATGIAYMTRFSTVYRVGDDGVQLPSWSRPDLDVNDVAIEPNGNVWVVGKTGETLYTLAKLTPEGDELWAESYPVSGMARLAEWVDLPVAPNGDVFATMRSGGSLTSYGVDVYRHDHSTNERTPVGYFESFDKNFGWLSVVAATVDSNETVAVAETRNRSNWIDVVEFARVARLHRDGYPIDGGRSFYAKPLPLEPDDIATAGFAHSVDLVTDANDRLVLLGTTNGEFTHPSAGKVDSFIAIWHPETPGVELAQFGTTGNDHATSLALSPEGELWITGNTDGSFTGEPAQTQSFLMHTSLSSWHCDDTTRGDGGLVDGGTSDSVEPATPDAGTSALDAGISSLDRDAAGYGRTELWSHEGSLYSPVSFESSGNFFIAENTGSIPSVVEVEAGWNIVSVSDPFFADSAPVPSLGLLALDHSGSSVLWNSDAYALEKYSFEAELLWSQPMNTRGGPEVAIDADDNLLMVWSQNGEPGQPEQMYLTKWTPEGNLLWQKELPDFSSPTVTLNFAGDVLVTGFRRLITERSMIEFFVYHSSGELAWSTDFGLQGPANGLRSAALGGDLSVCVGLNNEELGDHVVKFDTLGNARWTQHYPLGTDIVRVVTDQTENVTVLAETKGPGPIIPDRNVFVHRMNAHGMHRWVERFGTPEMDLVDSAIPAPNGDLLAAIVTRGKLTDAAPSNSATVFIRLPANHSPTAACFIEPCAD